MPLHKNQIVPLTIDSISNDGNGVGRFEGQVVFVPGTACGDSLQVKIIRPSNRYAFGRVEQVVAAGPSRIKADCPASAQCGGCSFRHISYEAELEAKHGFVADALKRIGGLAVVAKAPLSSPQEARYRNKVQYPVAADAEGKLCWGFYAARSHRIVSCEDCLLQPKVVNDIAGRTALVLEKLGMAPYSEETQKGLVRHIALRHGHYSGQLLLCLVVTSLNFKGREDLAAQLLALCPEITTIILNKNTTRTNVIYGKQSEVIYGDGWIEDRLCEVPLKLNERTFAQVNTLAAEQLFGLVRQLAAVDKDTVLLDLYCGTGVIGLSMARDCKTLIGVEVVAESVESAKQSASAMKVDNTRFLCEDAGSAAARLAQEGLRPQVVVVDPPRKGMDAPAMEALLAMEPKRVVMVSCNPATLARDLLLLNKAGYEIKEVQPVDMFPRTKHVECVALAEHS